MWITRTLTTASAIVSSVAAERARKANFVYGSSKAGLDAYAQGLGDWLMGSAYTVADIAIFPWVRCLVDFYGAGDLVGMADVPNVSRVLAAFVARPAVARGLVVPARG